MPDAVSPPHAANLPAHHRLAAHGQVGALHLRIDLAFATPRTVLFGPSGCGKSTLLRAMAGLAPGLQSIFTRHLPDGKQQILQDRIRTVPPERRALAYAPQQAALFPHQTVAGNVAFPLSVRGQSRTSAAAAIQAALALFDLEHLADRYPRHLSGGERQRVGLARAFAVPDARLVLLDEPFAGIDRALRDRLLPRMLQRLNDLQVPVLTVTHDVDEALLFATEVVRLHEGTLNAQGPPASVLADEITRLRHTLDG